MRARTEANLRISEAREAVSVRRTELLAARQTADEAAIEQAQLAFDEEAALLDRIRTEYTRNVEAAQALQKDAKNSMETRSIELLDAQRRVAQANQKLRDLIQQDRQERLLEASAIRLVERLSGKLDSVQTEVSRNTAARDAANRMVEKLAETLDASPFGPLTNDRSVRQFGDPELISLARIVWLASLSSADVASIGMTGNTNPFQFRKLVFWTTANNVDLQAFAAEIDGIIDNVVAIAQTAKTQSNQRKATNAARRKSMLGLIDQIEPDPMKADGLKRIIEIIAPTPVDVEDN